ncbi:hypothetical protein OPIT5_25440 [Opitutaceae bacterium TAV5]|nr:hypothetical protein OPIT5_25440 [Opitutaceae bacterium TAV5]
MDGQGKQLSGHAPSALFTVSGVGCAGGEEDIVGAGQGRASGGHGSWRQAIRSPVPVPEAGKPRRFYRA